MAIAKKISIENAKQDKLFYFVANVVVYRESDKRCLILKRDPREKVHPGKWALPGGKLEWKDLPLDKPTHLTGDVLDYFNIIETLLIRETKEEAGIEIGPPFHFLQSLAFVRPDETPVVCVTMAAKYLSGDIVLEEGAFTEASWVNVEEVGSYDTLTNVSERVKGAIKQFEK